MKTRSQTKLEQDKLELKYKKPLYEVIIDFDGASEAWKANKKSIGNGSYKYVCVKQNKNGTNCTLKCLPGEECCKKHLVKVQKCKKL